MNGKQTEKIFDYQRFEQNSRLAKLIAETEARQTAELSDDALEFVAAAGEATAKFEENDSGTKRDSDEPINPGEHKIDIHLN